MTRELGEARSGPKLSVIIATRDRPDVLADCLSSLSEQNVEPGLMEVVVVDDGSTSDLRPVVDEVDHNDWEMKLVSQEPSGLSVARNRGAAESRGDIIAYLDDDTIVSSQWASSVLHLFEETECDAMGGRVQLQFEGPVPEWLTGTSLRRYLAEFDLGSSRQQLSENLPPVGANCALSRRSFDSLGGFDVGLGRQAGSLLSNEDSAFFLALLRRGGRVFYEPSAQVLHRVAPERLTVDWFRRRNYAQGVSDVLLDSGGPVAASSRSIYREWLRAMRFGPILGRNLLQGRGVTNASFWWAYCRGRRDALKGRQAAVSLRHLAVPMTPPST